jgi:hypothetical protein
VAGAGEDGPRVNGWPVTLREPRAEPPRVFWVRRARRRGMLTGCGVTEDQSLVREQRRNRTFNPQIRAASLARNS